MTLTVIEKQVIGIIRGQALDIEIPVTNVDGSPANLSGATILFGMAATARSDYAITLTTSVSGSTITAALTSAIAEALTLSQYYFSCWVDISDDGTPVARGTITVYNDSRTA